jgi:hypothetical protein
MCPLDMLSSGLAVDYKSTAHEGGVDGSAKCRTGHLVASQTYQYRFVSPHSSQLAPVIGVG